MTKKVIGVVVVIGIVALAALAYLFLREPESATGPIEAVPLAATDEIVSAVTEGPKATVTDVHAATATEVPAATPTSAQESEPTPTMEVAETESAAPMEPAVPAETAPATEEPAPVEPTQSSEGTAPAADRLYEIVSSESEARFLIDEVLKGADKTVVGVTDQVSGQLAVGAADLSTAQVGTILVNARTLTTDNQFRNRAIKNVILRTDSHEFVTFVPTEIVGLPESGSVGESYSFQVLGDLTVTDVTREVTFDVTVTPVSETRIEGLATTSFPYRDFELTIPDAPVVDTVADDVRLELAFVAEAAQ